jgi:hypothetical protein
LILPGLHDKFVRLGVPKKLEKFARFYCFIRRWKLMDGKSRIRHRGEQNGPSGEDYSPESGEGSVRTEPEHSLQPHSCWGFSQINSTGATVSGMDRVRDRCLDCCANQRKPQGKEFGGESMNELAKQLRARLQSVGLVSEAE